MKYILILIALLSISITSYSQTCPSINASDQTSLDSWISANNGTCTALENLIISQDLDYSGLSFIDTVFGELRISDDVTSIQGLQNIEHVGELKITSFGSIIIEDLSLLNIKSVSDGIVFNNATLPDLTFIDEIIEIPNHLKFWNVTITDPDDLPLDKLKSVGWLQISQSPQLEDLNIFEHLDKVEVLELRNTTISSIAPLSTIDTLLTIDLRSNDNLVSLDFQGFNTLESIKLTSGEISTISNIEPNSLKLFQSNSTKLTDVSFLSQVDSIETLYILSGSINSLSALSNTVISVRLILDSTRLINLDGLGKVTSLIFLYIGSNNKLTSIDGLSNLTEVGPTSIVEENQYLSDCCILSTIHQNLSYGEAFPIYLEWNGYRANNDYNSTCSSISNVLNGCTDTDQDGINDHADNCIVTDNPDQMDSDGDGVGDLCDDCSNPVTLQLTTQQEVNDFQDYITDGCVIQNLYIEGEEDIVDLRPLSIITSIEGTLSIIDNVNLQSLAGLENITEIGGSLTIFSNSALTDINGLQGLKKVGEIDITETNLLESIDALSSIDSIFGNFQVVANTSLQYCCSMQPFITGQKYLGGTFSLGPNLEGCNTTIEIDAACTDNDGDDFVNVNDNCPDLYNYRQDDFDKDGIGDVCDNCPKTYNPNQVNQDNDLYGDACDKCPTMAGSNLDVNNNGIGDACEGDAGAENGYIGLGTENPNAKVEVENGDIYVDNIYRGVVLKSADGGCFRMKVQNDGTVISNKIDCPED